MNSLTRNGFFILLAGVAIAASAWASAKPATTGNAFYIYTKALNVDEAGVVEVPNRYRWSVETVHANADLQGQLIHDPRILLRLYDPDQNFTSLIAMMDVETATKLKQDLESLIAMKSADPTFQHQPQLYDKKLIPTKQLIGITPDGKAVVEDAP